MSDLVIPTREQIEALPPDAFQALYSTVASVSRRRAMRRRDTTPRKLAQMAVGDSIVFNWTWPRHLTVKQRESARDQVGNPDAEWTGSYTSAGLRVRRIR